jgi:hypothetical protein
MKAHLQQRDTSVLDIITLPGVFHAAWCLVIDTGNVSSVNPDRRENGPCNLTMCSPSSGFLLVCIACIGYQHSAGA